MTEVTLPNMINHTIKFNSELAKNGKNKIRLDVSESEV